MSLNDRHVWRAAPGTLAVVVVFVVAAATAIPALAYRVWTAEGGWLVPALLAPLSVLRGSDVWAGMPDLVEVDAPTAAGSRGSTRSPPATSTGTTSG